VGDPSRFIRLTGVPPNRVPLSRTVADAVGRDRLPVETAGVRRSDTDLAQSTQ
jgi:hypothetical protein